MSCYLTFGRYIALARGREHARNHWSIALTLILSASLANAGTTYQATLKGKPCVEGKDQQINCDYKIGTDFWLSIAGGGQTDAAVTFMKADLDGHYYATFGTMHGCVIVKPGKASKSTLLDFDFVSPRNGKVYRDWKDCKEAR